jgi:hypothetical protein
MVAFVGTSAVRIFLFRGRQSRGSALDWIDWILWIVGISIALASILLLYLLRRRGRAAYRAANSGTSTDLSLDVIYDTKGWSIELRETVATVLSQHGVVPGGKTMNSASIEHSRQWSTTSSSRTKSATRRRINSFRMLALGGALSSQIRRMPSEGSPERRPGGFREPTHRTLGIPIRAGG